MARNERDALGSLKLSDRSYFGIHTLRALLNFPLPKIFLPREFIWAYALVKKACVFANVELGFLEKDIGEALLRACDDLAQGRFDKAIVVHPLSGGAGTSINMNFNEVIANRALEILGYEKGRYDVIHPVETVNLHQSTNDTFPTAVRVCVVRLLMELKEELARLQGAFQKKEKEFAHVLKPGRTECQEAVPVTLGQEFSAWAEATYRDWWRIHRGIERVRMVNLGGGACGTGLNIPKEFRDIAIEKLREYTGLPVAPAENPFEATQNVDTLVEVSGFLKTLATNLIKIASDLRFLSSGPSAGIGEIILPERQVGSSIMPGKINPVIPEMVMQVGFKVLGKDSAINFAASFGHLELNPFLPLISYELITALKLLKNTSFIFRTRCINGIKADEERIKELLEKSRVEINAFLPYLGYEKCAEIYKKAKKQNRTIYEIIKQEGIFTEEELSEICNVSELTGFGFAGFKKIVERLKNKREV